MPSLAARATRATKTSASDALRTMAAVPRRAAPPTLQYLPRGALQVRYVRKRAVWHRSAKWPQPGVTKAPAELSAIVDDCNRPWCDRLTAALNMSAGVDSDHGTTRVHSGAACCRSSRRQALVLRMSRAHASCAAMAPTSAVVVLVAVPAGGGGDKVQVDAADGADDDERVHFAGTQPGRERRLRAQRPRACRGNPVARGDAPVHHQRAAARRRGETQRARAAAGAGLDLHPSQGQSSRAVLEGWRPVQPTSTAAAAAAAATAARQTMPPRPPPASGERLRCIGCWRSSDALVCGSLHVEDAIERLQPLQRQQQSGGAVRLLAIRA